MDASQIIKLMQTQNNKYINRCQTVDSSTLIWKQNQQASSYIQGVRTCGGGNAFTNVPTQPGCADSNGTCNYGGQGKSTTLMSGSTQQFPNVFAGAAGSASRVYSSDNILLQRASNNICGDAPTNPAPQNSYVVTQPCPEYCTDSNYSATVVNNQTNPYLPAVDTYYALKNPCVPSIDQNQKHTVYFCNDGCVNEALTMSNNSNIKPTPVINPVWASLGINNLGNGEYILCSFVNGSNVYIGGNFDTINGTSGYGNIAMWNGTSWISLNNGVNSTVSALTMISSTLYVGGGFTSAGGNSSIQYIAGWNGSTWSAIPSSPIGAYVTAFAVSGTTLYIVGQFSKGIISYNTSNNTWGTPGLDNNGLNGTVFDILINGLDIYVVGNFTIAGGNSANRVAKWNGSWSALGGGVDNLNVYTLAIIGTTIYIGGNFTSVAGNSSIQYIAQWNGSIWSAVGTGLNNEVDTMTTYNNTLYAGGLFINAGNNSNADYIAQWNGSIWSPVGISTDINNEVNSIVVSNNKLYVGGNFAKAIETYGPLQ